MDDYHLIKNRERAERAPVPPPAFADWIQDLAPTTTTTRRRGVKYPPEYYKMFDEWLNVRTSANHARNPDVEFANFLQMSPKPEAQVALDYIRRH
jgi:hypothetical protein